MIYYYASEEVWKRLTNKDILKNGCGSKFTAWFVPDRFCCIGLDLTIPCSIHDEDYALGKTYEDKIIADRIFRNNGYRAVTAMPKYLQGFGRAIVNMYVKSVQGGLGDVAYWRGKNNPDEMRTAIVDTTKNGIKIVKTIGSII